MEAVAQALHVRWGCAQPHTGVQAPHVPTWFFFDNNTNFLKKFNDDNNNTNSNF